MSVLFFDRVEMSWLRNFARTPLHVALKDFRRLGNESVYGCWITIDRRFITCAKMA